MLLTFDNDIPRILALRGAGGPSAVVIRVNDQTRAYVNPRVLRAIEEHAEALLAGAILVVTDAQARVRRLPIGC